MLRAYDEQRTMNDENWVKAVYKITFENYVNQCTGLNRIYQNYAAATSIQLIIIIEATHKTKKK